MATLDDIRRIVGTLSLLYPNFEKDKRPEQLSAMISAYHEILYDVDADLLEAAAKQHARNSKWFPAASELIESALNIVHFGEPTAEEAWLEVKREIRRVGSYGVPQFSCDQIKLALEGMGTHAWRELCLTDFESQPEGVSRSHFMRIYDALQNRTRAIDGMLPENRARIENRNALQLRDGKR